MGQRSGRRRGADHAEQEPGSLDDDGPAAGGPSTSDELAGSPAAELVDNRLDVVQGEAEPESGL